MISQLKEIYEYREMIFSLVRRELRGRYKGSVLGFLWTFINPLLQLAVYTIVFSVILKNSIEKYYIYLFVALVPWMFFSACITSGSHCVIAQKDMVRKIYFPRAVLPISFVTSQFVNMLFSFIIIFIILIVSGVGINLKAIVALPLVMVSEYVVALGITMLTAGLTVYFRDLEYILSIISMLWMYMSPIIYGVDRIPEQYLPIFYLNPLTPILVSYREILYYKTMPQTLDLMRVLILGVAILIIGSFVFSKCTRRFAEEL